MGFLMSLLVVTKVMVLLSGESFVFDSVLSGMYSSGLDSAEVKVFNINRNIDSGVIYLRNNLKKGDMVVLMGIESYNSYKKYVNGGGYKNYGIAILAMDRNLRNEVVSTGYLVGFDLLVSFSDKIKMIKDAFPDISKIAYFYTHKTSEDLDYLVNEAKSKGMNVVAIETSSKDEIKNNIKALKTLKVQFLLLSLDPLFLSDRNFQFILKNAMKEKIPVWGETRKYVAMGAVMGAEVSFSQLGSIAGDVINLIKGGEVNPGLFSTIQASSYSLFFNEKSIKKLKLKVREDVLKKAEKIYK